MADQTTWFEIFRDARNEWRWRLRTSNGRTIGESGEGYTSETHCRASIDRIIGLTKSVDVREVDYVAPIVPEPPIPIGQTLSGDLVANFRALAVSLRAKARGSQAQIAGEIDALLG